MLYDRALFAELLAVPETAAASRWCGATGPRRRSCAWPEAALRDIDVAEDYEQVRAQPPRGV